MLQPTIYLSEWKKFAETLKAKLIEINNEFIYLYGSIHFRTEKVNYRQLLKDDYFTELKRLLTSANIRRTEQKTISISVGQYPLLGNYIESVFLWSTYPEDFNLWWDSGLQSGDIIQNDQAIQFIVSKKEESAKKYSKDFFQRWLIIYAGGLGLHDLFTNSSQKTIRQGEISLKEISNSTLKEAVIELSSKQFTYIYVWDKFTEVIYQVSPYYKKIFDYGEKSIWINHLPIKVEKNRIDDSNE